MGIGLAINGNVGVGQANNSNDVMRVQTLLNACGADPPLEVDGGIAKGGATAAAIKAFQAVTFATEKKGGWWADEVRPGDRTLIALNAQAVFPKVGTLQFKRHGRIPTGQILGELTVVETGDIFATIERGSSYYYLKGPANFDMFMDRKMGDPPMQCLRPDNDSLRAFLVHQTNDDGTWLEGCIGVGMSFKMDGVKKWVGVRDGYTAIQKLWKLLGGWAFGKRCTLFISNNPSEDTEADITRLGRQ